MEKLIEEKDTSKKGYKDQTGFFKCAYTLWNHLEINEVDFNSFTFKDVTDVIEDIESMLMVPTDDGEEVFMLDPSCAFVHLTEVENAVAHLYRSKKKTFIEDEELLFI